MRDIDDAVGERAELDGCHQLHALPSLAEIREALEAGRNRPEVTTPMLSHCLGTTFTLPSHGAPLPVRTLQSCMQSCMQSVQSVHNLCTLCI